MNDLEFGKLVMRLRWMLMRSPEDEQEIRKLGELSRRVLSEVCKGILNEPVVVRCDIPPPTQEQVERFWADTMGWSLKDL